MPSYPCVTVAMVTYNSGKHIAEAIESVLASSYENFELLICDDHSSDDTWQIIERYVDRRIRAVKNDATLGEYPNRNQAIRLAKGDYLIYIDGDDLVYPHGLAFMVQMLEAFPQSAVALARPWSEKFVYPVELTPRQFYLCQFLGPQVAASNFAHIMFRTSTLRSVGGFDPQYRGGDYYIQFLIAATCNSLLISDGLAWWRRTSGQASEAVLRDNNFWAESIKMRRAFLDSPQCPLTQDEVHNAKANEYGIFLRMAIRYALRGRPAHGLRLVSEASVPPRAWKYVLSRSHFDYLSDVDGDNPLRSSSEANPFTIANAGAEG